MRPGRGAGNGAPFRRTLRGGNSVNANRWLTPPANFRLALRAIDEIDDTHWVIGFAVMNALCFFCPVRNQLSKR